MLDEIGPGKLLARKLAEVERKKAGVDASTLAEELQLKALVLEVGPLPGGVGGKQRHYLRVRDAVTGEICLEWSESRDQRAMTVGDRGHEEDRLTRRLHDGGAGESGSQHGSQCGSMSLASTPRSSVRG